mgnify:CR=1 FL=1
MILDEREPSVKDMELRQSINSGSGRRTAGGGMLTTDTTCKLTAFKWPQWCRDNPPSRTQRTVERMRRQ